MFKQHQPYPLLSWPFKAISLTALRALTVWLYTHRINIFNSKLSHILHSLNHLECPCDVTNRTSGIKHSVHMLPQALVLLLRVAVTWRCGLVTGTFQWEALRQAVGVRVRQGVIQMDLTWYCGSSLERMIIKQTRLLPLSLWLLVWEEVLHSYESRCF